jgi:hypothetical protein
MCHYLFVNSVYIKFGLSLVMQATPKVFIFDVPAFLKERIEGNVS